MSLEFLITALVVVLVPGTGVVYTVAAGLTRGRLASAAAALGCTLGILPAILASVFGLSALLNASALAFQLLKIGGVAYLLYLAVATWRQRGSLSFRAAEGQDQPLAGLVRTGFLINILNPKLTVFFMALLPQFVPATSTAPVMAMLAMGGVFMALTLIVFLIYGAFAAQVGAAVLASERVMTWMRRTVALTFAGFGLRLALSER